MTATIRAVNNEDIPFVLSSWLKSYRYSQAARNVVNDIYFSEQVGQKARILEMLSDCRTLVACDEEEGDCIYGWICAESIEGSVPPVVHYVYVKSSYRRRGLARALLKAAGVGGAPFWATHETAAIRGRIDYVYCPWYTG